ncbi:hypothetical protein NZD89_28510 (plasmid) [Alicyclobacillus fastidiosus]|uniref:Uncharacterized protein n=1 Tax=Alicyclobacillus fastidiosus TaxID=392011 RepID=A0ABY6ZPM8_9BACL|nr:hypothetical protein [Alicyclobacillus fastidiosus]WAH44802.1 hypothetical protein NZD89_28510 [Alicyclobacillus fastidiosus]GMA65759.1 hypothetical protein GCM10025859_61990 [Alicyclobacillus fastidiosus]GMA65932.1 hypothetical protein GCM10025859_63730 [Alicyclobacillus fastidiosus]
MPKTNLADVRAILTQHMMDTFAFEEMGGFSADEALSWFRDQVIPDVETILSQRV